MCAGWSGEEPVVRLVPGAEPVVEPGPAAQVGIDLPVGERAVERPGVVESGIAEASVAPVDDTGEAAVADEEMTGAEVGVEQRRAEPHQRLHLVEEPLRLCVQAALELREHEPFELAHWSR